MSRKNKELLALSLFAILNIYFALDGGNLASSVFSGVAATFTVFVLIYKI